MTKTTALAAISFDFAAASAAQIVALYNELVLDLGPHHGAKPVTRFADRKTAVARTEKLLAERNELAAKLAAIVAKPEPTAAARYVQGACPKCGDSQNGITCGKVVDRKGQQVVINEHEAQCHVCGHEFNYETGKALPKRGALPADHGAKIAASWENPEVYAARVTRNGVTFTTEKGTTTYKSVREAFEQLGLPLGRHIAFRKELKAAGSLDAFGGKWVVI